MGKCFLLSLVFLLFSCGGSDSKSPPSSRTNTFSQFNGVYVSGTEVYFFSESEKDSYWINTVDDPSTNKDRLILITNQYQGSNKLAVTGAYFDQIGDISIFDKDAQITVDFSPDAAFFDSKVNQVLVSPNFDISEHMMKLSGLTLPELKTYQNSGETLDLTASGINISNLASLSGCTSVAGSAIAKGYYFKLNVTIDCENLSQGFSGAFEGVLFKSDHRLIVIATNEVKEFNFRTTFPLI